MNEMKEGGEKWLDAISSEVFRDFATQRSVRDKT
jgi:hypothetical protein